GVGKVRIRNRNARRTGQRRVDIGAQEVQGSGGPVLLDEAVQVHGGHLVDVQQPRLQMRADGGVIARLNESIGGQLAPYGERPVQTFGGARGVLPVPVVHGQVILEGRIDLRRQQVCRQTSVQLEGRRDVLVRRIKPG